MNITFDQINQLLASIVPTFGVFGAGWLCRRIGIWDKSAVHVLNSYAYYIALPALILQSVLQSGIGSQFTAEDAVMIGGTVAVHLLIAVAAVVILAARRTKSSDLRAAAPMILVFGSTAYLGIPYATNTFGRTGTSYASLLSVALVVSMLFVSIAVLQRWGRPPDGVSGFKRFIELPFIWAVALGLAWSVARLPDPPAFVSRTLDVLAGSAGPTALLALGAFHFGFKLWEKFNPAALLLGLGKVLLPALATFVVLSLFGLSGIRLAVATAMSAVSVAVTAFVLADQYRTGRELVVASLTFSTIFSFIALSAISWLWISTDVFG